MEWKTVKLGDVVRLINGRAYSQPELYDSGKYKIVRVGNLSGGERWFYSDLELAEDKYCDNGDLLYAWACNFGPYIWKEGKTIYHYHIWKLVEDNSKVDRLFLYYYLKYLTPLWLGNVNGSVMVHITKGTMENFDILLPPLAEQERIAAILSSLDDKIENNNRINRNLEAQAQALFKSWFVDFEPWGGKMPADWKEYELPEIAEIFSGYSYKGAELQPSEDAMATIKNFDRTGYFKLDGYKEIIPSGKYRDYQFLQLFDVIVAHTDITQNADIIGNPAIVLSKGGYRNIIMSMDLCKVVPTHYALSSAFIYCLLKDNRFKSHALGYVNGTTVLHLSKKALAEYKVMLPSDLHTIQDMSNQLQTLFAQCATNIEESQRLAQLRDTLLPKLMKGEIEV